MWHRRGLPALLAAFVVLLLTGCGGGSAGGGSTSSTVARTPTPSPRASVQVPARHRRRFHASGPRTTGPHGARMREPAGSTRGRTPPAAPCGSARFGIHKVFPSTAAAGTQYTSYVITNLSHRTCTVSGYPRIVALGADGRTISGPAPTSAFLPHTGRRGPRTVTIAGHGTASVLVESSDVDPLGRVKDCRPRAVSGDRILLPGSRRAETMPSVVAKACAGGAGVAVGPIEVGPSRE
jgi:hypothetical protein